MSVCVISNNFDGNASETVKSISHLPIWAAIFLENNKRHVFKSSKTAKGYDFETVETDEALGIIFQNCKLFSYCKSGDKYDYNFFNNIKLYEHIEPRIGGFYTDYKLWFGDLQTIASAGSYDKSRLAQMKEPPRGFTLSPVAFQMPIPLMLSIEYLINLSTICPIVHLARPLLEINANFNNN